MLDTRAVLEDMAQQIRSCRLADDMTLQQLASRSGVAASTIHKVESRQMVPTVLVLLKIAKGLGRRADELVRDDSMRGGDSRNRVTDPTDRESPRRAGVWRIDLAANQTMPSMKLDAVQRAIVLVEKGAVNLRSGESDVRIDAGDCYEFEGGSQIASGHAQSDPASVTVIVSPPGNIAHSLETAGSAGTATSSTSRTSG